jgi:hypothetical protein
MSSYSHRLKRGFAVGALVIGVHLFPNFAHAGRMKDLHFLHLEAIAEYLYGNADTDGLQYRNSGFVAAENGYQFAVRSEILVFSSAIDDFEWVTCTTQIVETGTKSLRVAKTTCQ